MSMFDGPPTDETSCQKFMRLVGLFPVRDGDAAPSQLRSEGAPAALIVNVLGEIITRLARIEQDIEELRG